VIEFRLLGPEAGEEGADAELESVVGGDAGQQRGELDVLWELAWWQGGEEGPHAADELVAGLRVGAGGADFLADVEAALEQRETAREHLFDRPKSTAG
jgi:hypothetical protein